LTYAVEATPDSVCRLLDLACREDGFEIPDVKRALQRLGQAEMESRPKVDETT
jgi:hypothetical protein